MSPAHAVQLQCGILIGLQSGSSGFVHVVPVQNQICRTPFTLSLYYLNDKIASDAHIALEHYRITVPPQMRQPLALP